MRVDNVKPNQGIGFIKFNNDAEVDLIAESMDRLIKKQERIAEKSHNDASEIQKLERFKKSKDVVVEIPKQNRMRLRSLTQRMKVNTDKINKMNAMHNIQPIDVEDTQEFKNASKVIANSEIGSGLGEGTEVTHRNMHVLVNSLNNHIWELEQGGVNQKTKQNRMKYEKLVHMLEEAQIQKSRFERHTPKPRGWGRLRK
jgi:hypothetical protein